MKYAFWNAVSVFVCCPGGGYRCRCLCRSAYFADMRRGTSNCRSMQQYPMDRGEGILSRNKSSYCFPGSGACGHFSRLFPETKHSVTPNGTAGRYLKGTQRCTAELCGNGAVF